jgi:HEAT repeat protein
MAGPHAACWAIALIAVSSCQSPPSAELPDIPEEVQADDPQRKPAEYWAARLNSPSSATQQEALGQLGAYGRDASSYAPLIVPLLRDPDRKTGFTAAWTLARLGMGAHPLLIDRLQSENAVERERAAYGAGEMGPAAADAGERLNEMMTSDPSPRVRAMAAWALDQVAGRRSVADPNMALLSGLHGAPGERQAAVERLGAMAYRSRVAVRELIVLMGDSVPAIRHRAIFALAHAGLTVQPSLSAALSSRRKEIRRGAVLAISGMKRSF